MSVRRTNQGAHGEAGVGQEIWPSCDRLPDKGANILSSAATTVKHPEAHYPDPLTASLWMLPLAALLVVHLAFATVLGDAPLLGIWTTLALLLGYGNFVRLRMRRTAWLHAYVAEASPLRRWLRGGLIRLLAALIGASVLTAGLLLTSLQLQTLAERVALIAAMPLLVLGFALAMRQLAGHVGRRYLPEASARTTLVGNWILLTGALTLLALYRPGPDLAEVGPLAAMRYQGALVHAESGLLALGLEYLANFTGLRLWLGQHVTAQVSNPVLALAFWLLIVAEAGFTAWVWLRCCLAVILLRLTRFGKKLP